MAQRKLLGQILKEMRKIHEGHIQEALQIQRKQGGAIGEILVGLGAINRQDLAKALGLQAGMEVVDLDVLEPTKDALAKIDGTTATLLRVMPVRIEGKRLTVALADPLNASCLDELRFLSGCEVVGAIADEKSIEKALAKHYGADDVRSMKNAVEELKKEAASSSMNLDDKAALAHAAPVVKLLNYILYQAIKDRASDIHLEPFQNEFRVRYRVDGVLYEMEPPPVALAIALISRVKVMANLDIAETRIPQDGRIELAIGGRRSTCAFRRCRPRTVSRASCACSIARWSSSISKTSGCAPTISRGSGVWRRSRTASCSSPVQPARARPRRCTPCCKR
jgi:type IV pilus assembly protein PilB